MFKILCNLAFCMGFAYSMQSYTLNKSIITGNTLATDVEKIPSNVSVVDNKHIQYIPNTKITDTIKKLSGVRVDNDVGFNPRPKVKIRGINYGTLLMLDGVILSDLEGENRILNQISLYDVERVEVARGALSSLYGAGAIGGVVHFITAMPTQFQSQFLLSYGNELYKDTAEKNLIRAFASVGDVFIDKRLRVKLSAGLTHSDGYSSFPTLLPSSETAPNNINIPTDKAGNHILGDGGRRDYAIYDIRLRAEYDISDSDMLSSMISFSNHNYTFGHFKSSVKDSAGQDIHLINGKDYFVGSGLGGMGTYSHLLGNLTYQHDFLESYFKIAFSTLNLFSLWQDAKQGEGDRYGGAGTTQDIDSTSNYLDMFYRVNLNSIHSLNTAMQFRYYTFTQLNANMTNWKDYKSRTDVYRSYGGKAFVASAYMSVDSEWLPHLSSTLGMRYDYWKNFDGYLLDNNNPATNRNNQGAISSVFSPKASINYAPNFLQNIILKSSIGSGFRMPTMRDMYQFTHSNTYWKINPDLKQESALSFDIGVEYQHKGFEGKFYYYDTELWDMIYRSGTGKENNPYQNVNAGRGRIHGVEISAQVPILSDLYIESNYTLTLATIIKNNAKKDTEGKQLAATPKHMVNIALNYLPQYGLYASMWAYYAPAFYADDLNTPALSDTYGNYESQFTLNAKCGYNFKNGIDISASFANITNNRYYDFYQVAGASYSLQLRYKL
ncbi:TonB-dependent receptor [Helicobacter sp. MIT 21-1697]|uniref:TonB-dependent receptor n=1 Tax=Helicobacter sp. MIT 21-1697 TaxID=2993733 RepID=UPI00224B120D|nr:TonB-dependent receptor [Helicobacter sp. MIT 21-1697]MCX2716432.1 TonB-dependent receptor [Helicobacter sp. MIT 21-1697]